MDKVKERFAANLQAELNSHGLTQQDFCDGYNKRYEPPILRASVSHWITGTQFPRSGVIVNIANYFNRDVAWFFESSHTQIPVSKNSSDYKRQMIYRIIQNCPDNKLDAILLFLAALQQ